MAPASSGLAGASFLLIFYYKLITKVAPASSGLAGASFLLIFYYKLVTEVAPDR